MSKKFSCGHCGWNGDADLNGSKNIAALGAVVNQPNLQATNHAAQPQIGNSYPTTTSLERQDSRRIIKILRLLAINPNPA